VVVLDGEVDVLEGRRRQIVKELPASGRFILRWLVRGRPGSRLTLKASAPSLEAQEKSFALEATGGEG
jgi:hypothetical protein